MTDVDRIRTALRDIVDPCSAATGSNLDIVEMGLVKSIDATDGQVRVDIRLTSPMCHQVSYFMKEIEERVGDLDGIETVAVTSDDGFEWTESMMTDAAQRRRQAVLDEHRARYERDHESDCSPPDA